MSTIIPDSNLVSEMAGASPRWYLIQSQPAREKLAEIGLFEQGFDVLLPLITITKPRGIGQFRDVDQPLFSRYLFARCLRSDLQSVQYTRGVAGVVRFGEKPASVPDELIDEIIVRAAQEQLKLSKPVDFKHRDRVRVTSTDKLYGYEGLFDKYISNKTRAVILINSIAATVKVTDLVHAAVA